MILTNLILVQLITNCSIITAWANGDREEIYHTSYEHISQVMTPDGKVHSFTNATPLEKHINRTNSSGKPFRAGAELILPPLPSPKFKATSFGPMLNSPIINYIYQPCCGITNDVCGGFY